MWPSSYKHFQRVQLSAICDVSSAFSRADHIRVNLSYIPQREKQQHFSPASKLETEIQSICLSGTVYYIVSFFHMWMLFNCVHFPEKPFMSSECKLFHCLEICNERSKKSIKWNFTRLGKNTCFRECILFLKIEEWLGDHLLFLILVAMLWLLPPRVNQCYC